MAVCKWKNTFNLRGCYKEVEWTELHLQGAKLAVFTSEGGGSGSCMELSADSRLLLSRKAVAVSIAMFLSTIQITA